jgi:hypothetical protein
MIQPLSLRETKILIMTTVVIITMIVFNLIYVPLQDKKLSLSEQIRDVRRQMELDRLVIQKASGIAGPYQSYMDRFSLQGSQEEAVVAVLKELEEVIRTLSLDVDDLKPGPVKGEGTHYVFAVSLALHDDLSDLVRLLYALQQAPHYFNVDEIQIEKMAQLKDSGLKTRLVLSKVFVLSGSRSPGHE